jgi:outer membrane lipoprotein SlyB
MNRKVLWMCMAAGSTVGGYLPTFFGQGTFSVASILGSCLGGVAGVFAAARINADF